MEFLTRLQSRDEKSGLAYQRRDIADSINCFYLRVNIGNIFLALGLTPNADSFAESFTASCIFLILDFPGTYGSILIFLNLNVVIFFNL